MGGHVHIFCDEGVINLGKHYAKVYHNISYPGKNEKIRRRTKDVDWLAIAGDNDWVCITKDNKILDNERERKSLYYNGARVIVLMNSSQV